MAGLIAGAILTVLLIAVLMAATDTRFKDKEAEVDKFDLYAPTLPEETARLRLGDVTELHSMAAFKELEPDEARKKLTDMGILYERTVTHSDYDRQDVERVAMSVYRAAKGDPEQAIEMAREFYEDAEAKA